MRLGKILAGVLIGGLGQLGLIGSAAADVNKGLYIAADGGVVWTSNQDFGPGAGTPITYDLGFGAGAQVGYAFGGPRVEFEYNYRYNKADSIGSAGGSVGANGHISANSFLVNFLYDFDTGSKWVPYVGLGLGMADVSATTIKPNAMTGGLSGFLDGSSSKFAVQFIFGAEYLASDRVGIFIDWRGLWAANVNLNYGFGCPSGTTSNCIQTGTTSWDYWNGALNVGVHIHF